MRAKTAYLLADSCHNSLQSNWLVKNMDIVWLGHSAFRIQGEDFMILVDPFLRGNPSFPEAHFDTAIKGTTHIALTHGHLDHVGDTVEIAEKTGCKVICNFDLGEFLSNQGVQNLDVGNTGGTLPQGSFSVTFVDAKHSAALPLEPDTGRAAVGSANGLVFHFSSGQCVLHMGDTDIFTDMALINELHRPKIGIVPIGDRFTMGPAVAALSCRRFFDFDTVIPCHYGSFDVLEQTADGFLKAMEDQSDRVHVPKVGEVLTI